jgi:hypothetical protein
MMIPSCLIGQGLPRGVVGFGPAGLPRVRGSRAYPCSRAVPARRFSLLIPSGAFPRSSRAELVPARRSRAVPAQFPHGLGPAPRVPRGSRAFPRGFDPRASGPAGSAVPARNFQSSRAVRRVPRVLWFPRVDFGKPGCDVWLSTCCASPDNACPFPRWTVNQEIGVLNVIGILGRRAPLRSVLDGEVTLPPCTAAASRMTSRDQTV